MHSLLDGQLLARGGSQGEAAAVGTGVVLPARLSREHLGLSNNEEGRGGHGHVPWFPMLNTLLTSARLYCTSTRLPGDYCL